MSVLHSSIYSDSLRCSSYSPINIVNMKIIFQVVTLLIKTFLGFYFFINWQFNKNSWLIFIAEPIRCPGDFLRIFHPVKMHFVLFNLDNRELWQSHSNLDKCKRCQQFWLFHLNNWILILFDIHIVLQNPISGIYHRKREVWIHA